MVIVLGFFLPPVSIILMTARSSCRRSRPAFDLIWFGIVMTVVMEMGLIHPPVGLNIFVIKNIAPDIRSRMSSGACSLPGADGGRGAAAVPLPVHCHRPA
jgi:TRAP-type C4-dicarboxylate transport system permease large subunit